MFFRWAKLLLLTGVVVFAGSTVLVPIDSTAKPILDGNVTLITANEISAKPAA